MSTLEMTIAGGLAVVAAVGLGSMMSGMDGNNKEAEIKIAKTEFASNLGVFLYSSFGCGDLKANSYSGEYQKFEVTNWRYDGISPIASATKFKLFLLDEFKAKLELRENLPLVRLPVGNTVLDLKKTLLTVTAIIDIRGIKYQHDYNIPVLIDDNNEIQQCGDERSIAQTCTAMNGNFNVTTGQCEVQQSCSAHGSYVTLSCYPVFQGVACDTSRGVPQVNPVTNSYTCPTGAVATQTGADNWTVTRDCGKKCTAEIGHSLAYFTCLRCQGGGTANGPALPPTVVPAGVTGGFSGGFTGGQIP
jgi:hypothetical protein